MPAFLLVGGTAAALYVALASTLDVWMGLSPVVASIAAHGTIIPFAYAAQRSITFRSSRQHAIAFPRYLFVQGLTLGIAALITAMAAPLGPPWVFLLAGSIAAGCSFLVLKYWGFAEDRGVRE